MEAWIVILIGCKVYILSIDNKYSYKHEELILTVMVDEQEREQGKGSIAQLMASSPWLGLLNIHFIICVWWGI